MDWMTDNTEAQQLDNDWAAARLHPAPPEKTGLLKAAGMGFMRGGVELAKGTALAISALVPHEDAPDDGTRILPRKEDFFKFITGPLDNAEKYWTPDPESVGMAGQVVGALAGLPLQLAGGPELMALSAAMNSGGQLVDQGVDATTATTAAIGAGAANLLMMKLPQAGKGLLQTGGLVALNPMMGAGQDYLLKTGLEGQGYQAQADAIDPSNPVSRLVDLTMGGVFGALGYHGNRVIAKTEAAQAGVASRAVEYADLIKKAGGESAIREQLPVEVVDSLDTVASHLKNLKTNPFNKEVLAGVDKHLAALKTALDDVTSGRPVDVAAHTESVLQPDHKPLELTGLMDKLSARFGLPPEEESGVSALIQAVAKTRGMAVDEFIAKHFADVTNERPGEGARALYQDLQAEQTRGEQAVEQLLAQKSGEAVAMSRPGLGDVIFLYGTPGRLNIKGRLVQGEGLAHLIEQRKLEGVDGEAIARAMPSVIAHGLVTTVQGEGTTGERVRISHEGKTAVLSLYRDGERKTWLLTGWENEDGATGVNPLRAYAPGDPGISRQTGASNDYITSLNRHLVNEKGEPLFQNGKGAVSFLKDGRAVVHALENPDFSTVVHELAHVFSQTLTPAEKLGFDKWLLNHSRGKGAWSVNDHETFARTWEKYLARGEAPTPELQGLFDKFKSWLVDIYRNIVGSPLEMKLHPEVKKLFDGMLFKESLNKEVAPEVQAVRAAGVEHITEHAADLHGLAGEPDTTFTKEWAKETPPSTQQKSPTKPAPAQPEPTQPETTPAHILREIALHTYEDPELIKRFVADPTNVAGVLSQALENEAVQLKGATSNTTGQSLVGLLRERGIKDDRGDLKSLDVDKGLKKFEKKMLRPEGMALDKVLELAVSRGYLPEGSDTTALLDLVGQELSGKPVYPQSGEVSNAPEWFQSILNMNRRTGGKEAVTAEQAAAALRTTAAGKFGSLKKGDKELVLSAIDSINHQIQSATHGIDAQELQVGDRYMSGDLVLRTVTAERDGQLIMNDGSRVAIDGMLHILGEVDQSGRPPEKGYDPLDYQTEHLLTERGDFTLSNGTDAAGNEITISAREFIDTAKNDLAARENQKHLYDIGAACMGLEFNA